MGELFHNLRQAIIDDANSEREGGELAVKLAIVDVAEAVANDLHSIAVSLAILSNGVDKQK